MTFYLQRTSTCHRTNKSHLMHLEKYSRISSVYIRSVWNGTNSDCINWVITLLKLFPTYRLWLWHAKLLSSTTWNRTKASVQITSSKRKFVNFVYNIEQIHVSREMKQKFQLLTTIFWLAIRKTVRRYFLFSFRIIFIVVTKLSRWDFYRVKIGWCKLENRFASRESVWP